MERQALLDALSEFLMVEQGGFQLYRVAHSRASNPDLKAKYQEFLEETSHHREVLVELITRLGGDPDYVSPTARVAQVKAGSLLESAMKIDGLAPGEIEANDLENVLLAETKDQSDWAMLRQLALDTQDPEVRQALTTAVDEVGDEEDEHLSWANEMLARLRTEVILSGPAPLPERWQQFISGPVPAVTAVHPNPIEEGLLEGSSEPAWIPSVVSRSMQMRTT